MRKNFCLLACCFTLLSSVCFAQNYRKGAKSSFSSSQWYFGLQLGTNYSQALPITSFSEFSYHPATVADTEKKYLKRFDNAEKHIGLTTTFSPFRQINLSLSGVYYNYSYGYDTDFSWQDEETPTHNLDLTFQHTHRLTYLEFPLMVQYNFFPDRRIKPHVQLGFFYGILLEGSKSVSESGIDYASGGTVTFQEPAFSTFITPLYRKYHMGYLYGGGLTYRAGTLTMRLDINHKTGLSNITNDETRFSGTRHILGFGNVQDDLKIKNLEISLSLLFPLKFLSKDFKPVVL